MTPRSLHERALARAAAGDPVRVAVIGAGTFGGMFVRQSARMPGIEVVALADLDVDRARAVLADAGLDTARATDDGLTLLDGEIADVVVEATGDPIAATRHVLAALRTGHHVVNVTVEADALLGPRFAEEAEQADVVYSLAYGDQPALICELVDWARLNGFDVVCAGKGTLHRPSFHGCTPDTVWAHYGFTAEQVQRGGYDARMFTSFVDGTKSAVELAAVADATGLAPQEDGLRFPPAGTDTLATVCRPRWRGGALSRSGTVEAVSCVTADGAAVPRDLRFGVFVVVEAPDERTRRQLADYGVATDPDRRHAAIWRPSHLVGMELGTSVAAAALEGRATGVPRNHVADVAAVAKRDLLSSMRLDGEGGYTAYGRLMPAGQALAARAIPLALCRGARTTRHVSQGEALSWDDVALAPEVEDVADLRRALERRAVEATR